MTVRQGATEGAALDRWLDLARRAVAADAGKLTGRELVDVGWDHRVLRATLDRQPWIFRFPRRPDVLPFVEREGRVLALLRNRIPVAVPDWQVSATVDGQLVIGYPELPGHPAGVEPRGDGDFVLALPDPPPDTFVDSLAATLAALHAVPVPEELDDGGDDPRARWAAGLSQVSGDAAPRLLLDRWQRWLDDDDQWSAPAVLIHGDVHPGHTMVDDAGRLTGLIDWTDARAGDPAVDFVDSRHAYGPALVDRLLSAYRRAQREVAASPDGTLTPADEGIGERVVMWQSFGALNAALFGLDNGEQPVVDRARQRMAGQAARLAAGLPPV